MSIYHRFCTEVLDQNHSLQKFSLHYPLNFNFAYDVVDVLAQESPEQRALVWCNTENQERTFTFAQLKAYSCQFANVLKNAGIGKGDRVMLILKRHYEYWFAALALHRLGATMIPATHMLTVEDLVYRIQSANIKAILCTPQNQVPQKVKEAVARTQLPVKLWCVQADVPGFENLTRASQTAGTHLDRVPTLATDPMVLYFTSGTTGQPKGVIHDFAYPLAHIVTAKYWQQAQEGGLHFTVAETGWAKASWGKMYGQWLVGCAVMVYDFDNFDPKQLVNIINRYGVTSFCAPPTVYRYLARKGIPDMPSLRHASTAGEMLAPEVFQRFTQRTGIPLAEGYGQTETTLLIANLQGEPPVESAMGKASPLYQVELRCKDGSRPAPGEVGEVVVLPQNGQRPVGIFCGYLDNDALYAHAWRDGVYHTGDAAWQDENGRYWFYGRFDDIIKTGGYRVGPCEVEHVLLEHPGVAECSVVGVPDPLRGQVIKAVIRLSPGYSPSDGLELEIKKFCNSRLAEYKWVRLVEFVTDFPKTISGKIQKGLLRKNTA